MLRRFETYTGKLVDLSAPSGADICIEDIAWHLSRLSMFGGATIRETPYSVAQHSVLVMNRVKQTTSNVTKPILITALLYRSNEAYMGHIVDGMRQLLDLRLPLERMRMRLLNAVFDGLFDDVLFDGEKLSYRQMHEVEESDHWAMLYAAYHMLHSKGRHYNALAHLDEEYILRNTIIWPAQYAFEAFLNHYSELLPSKRSKK